MNIIKLGAIGSTNTYLKDLLKESVLPNYTVVWAQEQFSGRGQRGTSWEGEVGTSLMFSVLVGGELRDSQEVFYLNMLVALSVCQVLETVTSLPFVIKWPNDILSANSKVAGILVENVFKQDGEIYSIVGIGINVNQMSFNGDFAGSSLRMLTGNSYDREQIIQSVVTQLKYWIDYLKMGNLDDIYSCYHAKLFRLNQISVFQLPDGSKHNGIIVGVTKNGLLRVIDEYDVENNYDLKQIKLLY